MYTHVFRNAGLDRRATGGNAARPGAVHTGRLRARPVLETAHPVRTAAAHVAQSASGPAGDHREAVLQGDHRRHTHTAITRRHVSHGKVVRVVNLTY